MVYLNKALMSSDVFNLGGAPLFLTFCQCSVTTTICYVLGRLGGGGDGSAADASGWLAQFPRVHVDLPKAKSIMPLSVVFVGMITFNNLCLKWVEVSFYNVARSLTIGERCTCVNSSAASS